MLNAAIGAVKGSVAIAAADSGELVFVWESGAGVVADVELRASSRSSETRAVRRCGSASTSIRSNLHSEIFLHSLHEVHHVSIGLCSQQQVSTDGLAKVNTSQTYALWHAAEVGFQLHQS